MHHLHFLSTDQTGARPEGAPREEHHLVHHVPCCRRIPPSLTPGPQNRGVHRAGNYPNHELMGKHRVMADPRGRPGRRVVCQPGTWQSQPRRAPLRRNLIEIMRSLSLYRPSPQRASALGRTTIAAMAHLATEQQALQVTKPLSCCSSQRRLQPPTSPSELADRRQGQDCCGAGHQDRGQGLPGGLPRPSVPAAVWVQDHTSPRSVDSRWLGIPSPQPAPLAAEDPRRVREVDLDQPAWSALVTCVPLMLPL